MQFFQLALAACLSMTAVQAITPERLEARDAYFSYLKRATGKNTTLEAGTTRKTTLRSQCNELDRLQGLVKLGANNTRVIKNEGRQNLTDARLTQSQEQTRTASTRLVALQSNGTLVADCAVFRAHNKFVSQCHEIASLENSVSLSKNATALRQVDDRHNLTTAGRTRLNNQTHTASTRLAALTANTTLAKSCAVFTARDRLVSQCRERDQLMRLNRLASNATLLSEMERKRNMTSKQVGEIQKEVGTVKSRLAVLNQNATLAADCELLVTESKAKGKKEKVKTA